MTLNMQPYGNGLMVPAYFTEKFQGQGQPQQPARPMVASSQCSCDETDSQDSSRVKKHPWSPGEDEHLRILIERHGAKDWSKIAGFLPNRNAKQCHQRWNYFLSPHVRIGEWTAGEDQTILLLQHELGNRWAKISEELPGRTGHAIKNRYHQLTNLEKRRVVVPDSLAQETGERKVDWHTTMPVGQLTQQLPVRPHERQVSPQMFSHQHPPHNESQHRHAPQYPQEISPLSAISTSSSSYTPSFLQLDTHNVPMPWQQQTPQDQQRNPSPSFPQGPPTRPPTSPSYTPESIPPPVKRPPPDTARFTEPHIPPPYPPLEDSKQAMQPPPPRSLTIQPQDLQAFILQHADGMPHAQFVYDEQQGAYICTQEQTQALSPQAQRPAITHHQNHSMPHVHPLQQPPSPNISGFEPQQDLQEPESPQYSPRSFHDSLHIQAERATCPEKHALQSSLAIPPQEVGEEKLLEEIPEQPPARRRKVEPHRLHYSHHTRGEAHWKDAQGQMYVSQGSISSRLKSHGQDSEVRSGVARQHGGRHRGEGMARGLGNSVSGSTRSGDGMSQGGSGASGEDSAAELLAALHYTDCSDHCKVPHA